MRDSMAPRGWWAEWGFLSVVLAGPNVQARRLLRGVMVPWGVRDVREAHDGSHALFLLAERGAGLVLAEAEMSPLGGIEMTTLLRNSKDSPDARIPVILIANQPTLADVLAARAAGANLVLARPFSALALYQRIDALVNRPRRFRRPMTAVPLSAGLLPPVTSRPSA